jgi:Clp amino terminal domain, pathogenicity island component
VPIAYDRDALSVLNYTHDEASRRNDPHIKCDHLFIGLVRQHEGGAGRLLDELGVDLDKARYRVGPIRHPPPRPPGSPGWESPGFTVHLREALAWAEEEATRLGHAEVRTEHLLLGLLAVPIHGGAGLLRICGADPDIVWRRTYEMLEVSPEQRRQRPEPPPFQLPNPRLQVLRRVVPIAESHSRDGHTLTLLSLEDYADGFLIRTHFRTESRPLPDRGVPEWPPKSVIVPVFTVAASDDRGKIYEPSPFSLHGSFGGGYPSPFGEGDVTPRFSPALAADARILRTDVVELRWMRQEHGTGHAEVVVTLPLGWVFEISLASGRFHVGQSEPLPANEGI